MTGSLDDIFRKIDQKEKEAKTAKRFLGLDREPDCRPTWSNYEWPGHYQPSVAPWLSGLSMEGPNIWFFWKDGKHAERRRIREDLITRGGSMSGQWEPPRTFELPNPASILSSSVILKTILPTTRFTRQEWRVPCYGGPYDYRQYYCYLED